MKLRVCAVSSRSLLAIEICLLAAGGGAIGYCVRQWIEMQRFQAEQARIFDLARLGATPHSAPQALASRQSPATEKVVGRIQVARLGISAMIVDGVSDPELARAVGHIPGTPLPGELGNVALAGHRDTFFRPLRNIRIADEIDIATLKGKFRYRVTSTAVVDPGDVSVLKPTPDHSLTLVTCYPFDFIGSAPKRFVVWAKSETP